MSVFNYDTSDHDCPSGVRIVQLILLFLSLGVLVSIWRKYQFCSTSAVVQNCWSLFFVPKLVISLLQLGAFLRLIYGLERRRRYARWLTGVLIIFWIVVSTNETHYTQLVLGTVMPTQELPTPPYKCWQSELALGNRTSFCGYDSYTELARKVLTEISILVLAASPGVWLITNQTAKRYFAKKTDK